MSTEHGAVSKRKIDFKVFFEGVEVPCSSVTITRQLGVSVCEIAVEPDEAIDRFRARSQIWVFVRDPYITPTSNDPIDKVMDSFTLEWRGEFVRYFKQESGAARHIVLMCVDDQNFLEKQSLGVTEIADGIAAPFVNGSSFWIPDDASGNPNIVFQALAQGFLFPKEQFVKDDPSGVQVASETAQSVEEFAERRKLNWRPLADTTSKVDLAEDNLGFRSLLAVEFFSKYAAPLRLHLSRSELLQRYRTGSDKTFQRFVSLQMMRDMLGPGAVNNFSNEMSVMDLFDWLLRKGFYSRVNMGSPPVGRVADDRTRNQISLLQGQNTDAAQKVSDINNEISLNETKLTEVQAFLDGPFTDETPFSGIAAQAEKERLQGIIADLVAQRDALNSQIESNSSDITSLGNKQADPTSIVQDFGIVPNLYYAFPPVCNWLFPTQLETWSTERDHLEQMTRLAILDSNITTLNGIRFLAPGSLTETLEELRTYIVGQQGGAGRQTAVGNAVGQPNPAQGQEGFKFGDFNLLNSMTVEEMEKGILYKFQQADFDYFSAVAQKYPGRIQNSKAEDIENFYENADSVGSRNQGNSDYKRMMLNLAEFHLLFSQLSRTMSVQGPYNRWPVIGMPMIVARREDSAIGLLTGKIDTLNVGGNATTAYTVDYVRTFKPEGSPTSGEVADVKGKLREIRKGQSAERSQALADETGTDVDASEELAGELSSLIDQADAATRLIQKARGIISTTGVSSWTSFVDKIVEQEPNSFSPSLVSSMYNELNLNYASSDGDPAKPTLRSLADNFTDERGFVSPSRMGRRTLDVTAFRSAVGSENLSTFFNPNGQYITLPAGSKGPANQKLILGYTDADVMADYEETFEAIRTVVDNKRADDVLANTEELNNFLGVLAYAEGMVKAFNAPEKYGGASGPLLVSGALDEVKISEEYKEITDNELIPLLREMDTAAIEALRNKTLHGIQGEDAYTIASAALGRRRPDGLGSTIVFHLINDFARQDPPVESMPSSFDVTMEALGDRAVRVQSGDDVHAALTPFYPELVAIEKRLRDLDSGSGGDLITALTVSPEFLNLLTQFPIPDPSLSTFFGKLNALVSTQVVEQANLAQSLGYKVGASGGLGSEPFGATSAANGKAFTAYLMAFFGTLEKTLRDASSVISSILVGANDAASTNSDLITIQNASSVDANVVLNTRAQGMVPILPYGDFRYLDPKLMDKAYATLLGSQQNLTYEKVIGQEALPTSGGVAALARATSTDERKAKMNAVFRTFSFAARKMFPFSGTEAADTRYGKWMEEQDPVKAVDDNVRRQASAELNQVTIRRFLEEFPKADLSLTTDTGRDGVIFYVFKSKNPEGLLGATEAAFGKLRVGRYATDADAEALSEGYTKKTEEQPFEVERLTEIGRQRDVLDYSRRHVGERPILGR